MSSSTAVGHSRRPRGDNPTQRLAEGETRGGWGAGRRRRRTSNSNGGRDSTTREEGRSPVGRGARDRSKTCCWPCAGGGEEAGPSEHAAGKYGSRRKEHVHVRRVSRAVRRPRPPSNSTRGRARRAYLALRCRARRALTLRALPLRRGVRREWRVVGSRCSSTRRVGEGKEGEEGGGGRAPTRLWLRWRAGVPHGGGEHMGEKGRPRRRISAGRMAGSEMSAIEERCERRVPGRGAGEGGSERSAGVRACGRGASGVLEIHRGGGGLAKVGCLI